MQFPLLQIDIISSNDSSDLQKREADIAIRNYRPTQPELIAKKINESSFHLYGSHDYLKSLKSVKKLEDLADAHFIGFENTELVIKEMNRHGLPLTHGNFIFRSNSHLAHWELVKQGAGIGFMATFIGDKEKMVSRVLPKKLTGLKFENWLVSHRELKKNRKIKAVFDFLYENLPKQM